MAAHPKADVNSAVLAVACNTVKLLGSDRRAQRIEPGFNGSVCSKPAPRDSPSSSSRFADLGAMERESAKRRQFRLVAAELVVYSHSPLFPLATGKLTFFRQTQETATSHRMA
jgi:hypothetical protein